MTSRVIDLPPAPTLGQLAALLSPVPMTRGDVILRLASGSTLGCSAATLLVSWGLAYRRARGTLRVEADSATWSHLHRSNIAELLELAPPVSTLPSPAGVADLHLHTVSPSGNDRHVHKALCGWLRERCRVAEEWVDISDGLVTTLTGLLTVGTVPTVIGYGLEGGHVHLSVAQNDFRPLSVPKGPAVIRHFDHTSSVDLFRATGMGVGLDPALALPFGIARVNRGVLRVRTGARLWQHGPEGEGATPIARLPGVGVDLELDVSRRLSLDAKELDDEDDDWFDGGDDVTLESMASVFATTKRPLSGGLPRGPSVIPLRPRAEDEWLLRWRTTDRFRVVFEASSVHSARVFAERILDESLDAELASDSPTGLDGEKRTAYSYRVDVDGQSLNVDVDVSAEYFNNSLHIRPLVRPSRLKETTLVPTVEHVVGDALIDLYDHSVIAQALGMSESELRGHVTRKRCLPRSRFQDGRPGHGHDLYSAEQVDAILVVYGDLGGPRKAAARAEESRSAIAALWGELARPPRAKPIVVCPAATEIDPTLVGSGKWVATWSESDEYRAVVRAANLDEAVDCANVLRGFIKEQLFSSDRPWDIEAPGRIVYDGVVFDVAPSWQVTDFDSTVQIVPVEGLRAVARSEPSSASRLRVGATGAEE